MLDLRVLSAKLSGGWVSILSAWMQGWGDTLLHALGRSASLFTDLASAPRSPHGGAQPQ